MKMSRIIRFVLVLSIILATLALTIEACGGSATVITTVSLPVGSPDRVEVHYFYESDACFCLNLASEWVNTTINTDYKAQLGSGRLVFKTYDTKSSTSATAMAEFNATKYAFFITTVKGTLRDTHEVKGLWLYTDSSGKNEMLKSKFIGLLKLELDKALAGD